MPKKYYVVYEIWTKARVIEASSYSDAYTKGEPAPRSGEFARGGLRLSNWHLTPFLKSVGEDKPCQP